MKTVDRIFFTLILLGALAMICIATYNGADVLGNISGAINTVSSRIAAPAPAPGFQTSINDVTAGTSGFNAAIFPPNRPPETPVACEVRTTEGVYLVNPCPYPLPGSAAPGWDGIGKPSDDN